MIHPLVQPYIIADDWVTARDIISSPLTARSTPAGSGITSTSRTTPGAAEVAEGMVAAMVPTTVPTVSSGTCTGSVSPLSTQGAHNGPDDNGTSIATVPAAADATMHGGASHTHHHHHTIQQHRLQLLQAGAKSPRRDELFADLLEDV